jgi:predicted ATP-grasp superfamily ATP-dependent carboligase
VFDKNFVVLSVEGSSEVDPPIADLVDIVTGPNFESFEFVEFINHMHKGSTGGLLLPFMDSACRALANWASQEKIDNCFFGCPDSILLSDKSNIQSFFDSLGFRTPIFTGAAEFSIVKPRFGFGSRNIFKVATSRLSAEHFNESMLVQDFIEGPEVSLDFYVSKEGEFAGIARERIRVSDGEVMETRTRNANEYELELIRALTQNYRTLGPLNLQLIGNTPNVLEVNPRFSGGSTASIAAGWDAIFWLIQEYLLGQAVHLKSEYQHVHVIRSRRDHIRRVN